jgi:hypothetical protein
MKRLPKFNEVNESAAFDDPQEYLDSKYSNLVESVRIRLDVDPPFDISAEEYDIKSFKLQRTPITVTRAFGKISDDDTDISIDLSNGDHIRYIGGRKPAKATIIRTAGEKMSVPDIESYIGSQRSLVGDILLAYKQMVKRK